MSKELPTLLTYYLKSLADGTLRPLSLVRHLFLEISSQVPSKGGGAGGVVRLVSLRSLKDRAPSAGFPDCPDDEELCVTLESIDRSTAFVVFVSHCWLRSHTGAEGYNGRPHPDNAQHEKFALTIEGVEKAWRTLAPGMTECYLWIDYSCINQDGDPAGELKQLDKIVQACDCIFTPIVDHDWRRWGSDQRYVSNMFEDYRAPLWRDGQYAYVNRAWCRMEMLYAANLDLHADVEQRRSKFAAGLRSAAERNFRPHLLYGTRESQQVGVQPLMLPPLQNSFAITHSPSTGSITKESDWPKIDELMGQLRIRRVVEGYEGERKASRAFSLTGSSSERDDDLPFLGQMHGQGKLTLADGDVYEGQFENDRAHGRGVCTWANGSVYEGQWENGLRHGRGVCRWANGSVYEGQYESGQRHGQGTLRFANGDVYVGQWERDKKCGPGTLRYASWTVYEGEWRNDQYHGQGTSRWADGNVYEGQYKNDQRHGQGTLRYADGTAYKGQYKNDKRHGQGSFKFASGNVYEGQWENDNMHGQGKKTSASGAVLQEGRWERGTFISLTKSGFSMAFTSILVVLLAVAVAFAYKFHQPHQNQLPAAIPSASLKTEYARTGTGTSTGTGTGTGTGAGTGTGTGTRKGTSKGKGQSRLQALVRPPAEKLVFERQWENGDDEDAPLS